MKKVTVAGDGVTFTIAPGNVKPGEKVYILAPTGAISSIGMMIKLAPPPAVYGVS